VKLQRVFPLFPHISRCLSLLRTFNRVKPRKSGKFSDKTCASINAQLQTGQVSLFCIFKPKKTCQTTQTTQKQTDCYSSRWQLKKKQVFGDKLYFGSESFDCLHRAHVLVFDCMEPAKKRKTNLVQARRKRIVNKQAEKIMSN
jgi:hypothetical protein